MKKRMLLLFLTLSLVATGLCSTGWARDNSLGRDDPTLHEWAALDVLVARPIGVIAAIVGTGVFVVGLPFTLTHDIISRISGSSGDAVNESAKMFMLKPLQFSFVRQFPDEDI